jgi:hypothetical protein
MQMTWLSTEAAQTALLDELTKIGEASTKVEPNKERLRRALKTIGLAAAGTGLGLGAFEAVKLHPGARKFLYAQKPVTRNMLRAAAISIPTLAVLGQILGSRYRKKADEGLSAKPTPNARRT